MTLNGRLGLSLRIRNSDHQAVPGFLSFTVLFCVILQEDIELMIAQFQEQDRKRHQVVEEKCPPPSPRFVGISCILIINTCNYTLWGIKNTPFFLP